MGGRTDLRKEKIDMYSVYIRAAVVSDETIIFMCLPFFFPGNIHAYPRERIWTSELVSLLILCRVIPINISGHLRSAHFQT